MSEASLLLSPSKWDVVTDKIIKAWQGGSVPAQLPGVSEFIASLLPARTPRAFRTLAARPATPSTRHASNGAAASYAQAGDLPVELAKAGKQSEAVVRALRSAASSAE